MEPKSINATWPSIRNVLQKNKRNKVLHRLYEPLVLLHVLGKIQGDHMPRQREDSLPPDHASRTELRRRFLESLAYVCDYEKGGNTMTAIFVSSAPLTYHVASNKPLAENNRVVPFLDSLLNRLRTITHNTVGEERQILEQCVAFSEKRILTYWRSLQNSLKACREASLGDTEVLQLLDTIDKTVAKHVAVPADLCTCCFDLMKSTLLSFVKEKATKSEDFGNSRSPFADLRHFIGRLGNHVQVVKVLLAGAHRFPGLIEDCQFKIVNGPPSLTLSPPPRSKLTIAGIVNRMINGDEKLKKDLETRLMSLDDALGIEQLVREEYGEKNLKPRVHAELVLLAYCYRERGALQFYDNDRYIGASKPACYCCSLYIREHPGGFVQPATHQRIYLNWIPPTSTLEVGDPNSETAIHERRMLTSMVKAIRQRTIEQLKAQTGGESRQFHFDSITWETLPDQRATTRHDDHSLIKVLEVGGGENQGVEDTCEKIDAGLSNLLNKKISLVDESDDSDTGGGVILPARHLR